MAVAAHRASTSQRNNETLPWPLLFALQHPRQNLTIAFTLLRAEASMFFSERADKSRGFRAAFHQTTSPDIHSITHLQHV
jgi:hypothetical protein